MSDDLAAVERDLERIPDIRAVRVVADEHGAPVEIHVLAVPGKHTKQLVRDVQSVAMAAHGLDVDHRIVSIVQLDDVGGGRADGGASSDGDERPGMPVDAARLVLQRVQLDRQRLSCSATVALNGATALVVGEASGSVAGSATWRTVAEAAVDALRQRADTSTALAVESVVVVPAGQREVALVVITVMSARHEEVLTGSACVRHAGVEEAIARAVLDACNRRVAIA